MANYGLKIAKPNVNVLTATKLEQIFNSSKVAFKIIRQGFLEVAVGSGGDRLYTDIEHNLGYTPAVLAYYKLSDEHTVSFMPYSANLFNADGEDCFLEVNFNSIRFGLQRRVGASYVASIGWYMFANRIDA
jgi:hypothetical protein